MPVFIYGVSLSFLPRHHCYIQKFTIMSRLIFPALLLAVAVTLVSYKITHIKHTASHAGGDAGFAVVELFTSEGCSSCPPADAALAGLLNEGKSNVYVLGFHVDYWNNLGWRDVYSNALYSARQQGYSGIFKLNSVYTPQAVVNGKIEFTGSDTKRLNDAVENGLNHPAAGLVEITAKSSGKVITVLYKLSQPELNSTINIALVQLHAQSNVKNGENSGKMLNHVNVVRNFKTVNYKLSQGDVVIEIPEGLVASDCKIIAFAQKASGEITCAAQTAIQ